MLPLAEVQTAVYEALALALAPVPVLDQAGPNETFPYVSIGEFVAVHDDTLREQAIDLEITIHVWSRQPGFKEAQVLMETVKNTLDRAVFDAPTWQWVTSIWTYAQTLREPDGETRHGILRFRVMTFQEAVVLNPISNKTER